MRPFLNLEQFPHLNNLLCVFQLSDANVEDKEEEQEAWVNALLGRIFWDFLGEKYWSDLVSKKIQMKLSKIKVTNLETHTSHS